MKSMTLRDICAKFEERAFEDECFLCGSSLTEDTQSVEHVIPKWLQARFNLWDQRLILLNRTEIPYRDLVVPCCRKCNGEHLAKIEADMQRACDKGPESVAKLSPLTLFLWLGKLFYGLLFRELSLRAERSNPDSGPIVPKHLIQQYSLHHLFLQASRMRVIFDNCFPASILVFRLQVPTSVHLQFHLRDDLERLNICLRMGEVGVLAALQDARALEKQAGFCFEQYQQYHLHPLQFEELGAKFFCWSSKMNRVPKYVISGNEQGISVFQLPLAGLSSKPVFDDFEPMEYAEYLSAFTGYPVEAIYVEPDQVMTWLHNSGSTEFRHMDLAAVPYEPGRV